MNSGTSLEFLDTQVLTSILAMEELLSCSRRSLLARRKQNKNSQAIDTEIIQDVKVLIQMRL